MADYEFLLDSIIQNHKSAGASLWLCARDVHALFVEYGRMEAEFMSLLTAQLSIGRDSVYHMRKAWALRVLISEAHPGFVMDGLLISHAYTACDYLSRLGVEAVSEWLGICREEHWSSRRLGAELAMAVNDSGTLPWLMSRIGLEATRLGRLYDNSELAGLSDHKRRRLRRIIVLLDGLTQKTPAG